MAERKGQPVSQRRSKLVENLLANQLAQSGQPAYSPLEVAGRLAMVYALNKEAGQNTAAEQAQMQSLVDVLAPQQAAQFGADTPELPGRPETTDVPTPTPEAMQAGMAEAGRANQLRDILMGLGQQNPEMVTSLVGALAQDQLIGAPARQAERTARREDFMFQRDIQQEDALEQISERERLQRERRNPVNILRNGEIVAGYTSNGQVYDRDGNRVSGVIIGNAPFQGSSLGDLTPVEQRDYRSAEIATLEALGLNRRLQEQAATTNLGVVGFLGQAGDTIRDQVRQASSLFGTREFDANGKELASGSLLDPSRYRDVFDSAFSAEAVKSAQLQSNLVAYFYMRAQSRDPGGRITEADIKNEMRAAGQSGFLSGSANQLIGALREQEAMIKMGLEIRSQVMGRPLPSDYWSNYSYVPESRRPQLSPQILSDIDDVLGAP